MTDKSLEQRLYEAWRSRRGIRFSAEDIQILVYRDMAMRKRILNIAASEAGIDNIDVDVGVAMHRDETWGALKRQLQGIELENGTDCNWCLFPKTEEEWRLIREKRPRALVMFPVPPKQVKEERRDHEIESPH